jgi:hypothetical protein
VSIARYPAPVLVSALFAIAGLLAVGIGGFLPWLRSGAVLRSSFEAAGVAGRLGPWDAPLLDVALAGWIAIPLLCAICIAVYVIGLIRTAAGFAVIVSFLAGTVALAAYVLGSGGSGVVTVVAAGPLTTSFGAAVALVGSVAALLARRSAARPAHR